VAARACNRSASESAPRLQTWARWPGYPATQLGGQLCGSEFDGVAVGCRPIPAHRHAPKLSDARPGSFTFRIYEAAVRGRRRSAISCRWHSRREGQQCGSPQSSDPRTASRLRHELSLLPPWCTVLRS
jgi:hypothetical protein